MNYIRKKQWITDWKCFLQLCYEVSTSVKVVTINAVAVPTWSERFQEDVCPGAEPAHHLRAGWVFQVHRHRPLATSQSVHLRVAQLPEDTGDGQTLHGR